MIQDLIHTAVKGILDEYPAYRACGSCPIGCDDLTRFICAGFSGKDITKWLKKEKKSQSNYSTLE